MTKRGLSDASQRIRPAVFAVLQGRIDQRAAKGEELIPLHIGDTHLAPPEGARAVLGGLDSNDVALHRYGPTAGLAPLREAIARVTRGRGLDVDPVSEVLVGNGGTHALFCAARAVLDAGDEVILASPYWPLAPGIFAATGAIPVEAQLTQKLYEDPSLDPAVLLGAALGPRTKALYFISPNNPDGKVLTPAQIERIAWFAREHDLWVFADEVYAEIVFAPDGAVGRSIATLPGMWERTMVLHSLSKSHALAGLRVGFVLGPESVITASRRVSTHTAFNVSVAMQRAGVAALSDDAFPQAARDVYLAARDASIRALSGATLRFHAPEGATYLFLDFAPAFERRPSDREGALYEILERAVDRGVLLAPGEAFGAGFGTFARLCYTSVPIGKVVSGIERVCDAVEAYVRG
jgi:aspartate/methionine/tyrosine aminotransferase